VEEEISDDIARIFSARDQAPAVSPIELIQLFDCADKTGEDDLGDPERGATMRCFQALSRKIKGRAGDGCFPNVARTLSKRMTSFVVESGSCQNIRATAE
jgi:hypothetical protein